MVDMKNDPIIVIWEGCDPTVSEAIRQFQDRWRPYSASSRRYPIVRLIQELIDPAVAAYMAALPVLFGPRPRRRHGSELQRDHSTGGA